MAHPAAPCIFSSFSELDAKVKCQTHCRTIHLLRGTFIFNWTSVIHLQKTNQRLLKSWLRPAWDPLFWQLCKVGGGPTVFA